MVTPFTIDFGNGIVCQLTPAPGVATLEKGSYGLDVPEFDVQLTENSGTDGGRLWGTRVPARHMRVSIAHPRLWALQAIRRAFTPNVVRQLTTPLGTMPYTVEAIVFPDSLWESQFRFAVNIVSPLGFPEGAPMALSAEQGASPVQYATTTYSTGLSAITTRLPEYAGDCWFAQTFPVATGARVSEAGVRVGATGMSGTAYLYLCALVDGAPDVANPLHYSSIQVPTNAGPQWAMLTCDEYIAQAQSLAVVCRFHDFPGVGGGYSIQKLPYRDPAAGYAGGKGMHRNAAGAWVDGDGVDTSVDWGVRFTIGTAESVTTKVYLDAKTDVPCAPRITVTLGSTAESLSVSDGIRTATITGHMNAGDVVVLDCGMSDPGKRTVTVNGTNRLSWFDKAGKFPMLYPDTTFIEVDVASELEVEWKPRLMGLL